MAKKIINPLDYNIGDRIPCKYDPSSYHAPNGYEMYCPISACRQYRRANWLDPRGEFPVTCKKCGSIIYLIRETPLGPEFEIEISEEAYIIAQHVRSKRNTKRIKSKAEPANDPR